MAEDALARHQEAWNGFLRFLKWSIAGIVILLALMAIFLAPH